jgi:hypothetical protein
MLGQQQESSFMCKFQYKEVYLNTSVIKAITFCPLCPGIVFLI